MRRFRTLIATSIAAALTIATLAAPVGAATQARMAVVNGIPGIKIDVCIGNAEVRSNLPYGGVYKKKLNGMKKLRFRKARAGKCKGKLLGAKSVWFGSGADKTFVATSKTPKVLVFDNSDLGIQPAALPPVSALAIRHGADLNYNTVHFHLKYWDEIGGGVLSPSLAATDPNGFDKKGQFTSGLASTDLRLQALVTRQNDTTVLRRSPIFEMVDMRRYEFYFVGTNAANSRLVRVTSTLATAPVPPPVG